MKISGGTTIQKATQSYEKWLGERILLVPEDLGRKHEAMRESPFLFLRATYYRWTQLWPQVRKSARNAREVLAVGRPARREFRHLARRRGASGLGDQRLR